MSLYCTRDNQPICDVECKHMTMAEMRKFIHDRPNARFVVGILMGGETYRYLCVQLKWENTTLTIFDKWGLCFDNKPAYMSAMVIYCVGDHTLNSVLTYFEQEVNPFDISLTMEIPSRNFSLELTTFRHTAASVTWREAENCFIVTNSDGTSRAYNVRHLRALNFC